MPQTHADLLRLELRHFKERLEHYMDIGNACAAMRAQKKVRRLETDLKALSLTKKGDG